MTKLGNEAFSISVERTQCQPRFLIIILLVAWQVRGWSVLYLCVYLVATPWAISTGDHSAYQFRDPVTTLSSDFRDIAYLSSEIVLRSIRNISARRQDSTRTVPSRTRGKVSHNNFRSVNIVNIRADSFKY